MMAAPNPQDIALIQGAQLLLDGAAHAAEDNPFAQTAPSSDFQIAEPTPTALTMNDIRAMQAEFYNALQSSSATRIANVANAIRIGIGVIKGGLAI